MVALLYAEICNYILKEVYFANKYVLVYDY
jgi:hypothetical protein